MTDAPENIWPDTLKIRDCKIYDDLGGSGKRIYTTAGNGYERKEYTRTDISQARYNKLERQAVNLTEAQMQWEARIAELEAALSVMVNHEVDYMGINNLGDPEEQHRIKQARAALKAKP
jgi:hypothetical protein